MDEPNIETVTSGSNQAADEATPAKAAASAELPVQVIMPVFLLAVIEFDFVSKFILLIRSHAPLSYVSSAVLIQLSLVMVAITYLRIWRTLRSTNSSTVETDKLHARIGYMVMCLLFTLMFYSHYTSFAEKAR